MSCCCFRSGEADVQVEVSEPQMQDSAAGPVHDVCQQDDDQDDDHQPEEEHDDSGDDVPSYSSRSSHGLQLPGAARIIRNRAWRGGAWPSAHWRPARPPGRTTHDTATLMRPAGRRPGPVIASHASQEPTASTYHARLGVKGPLPPSDASARGVKGPLAPNYRGQGPLHPVTRQATPPLPSRDMGLGGRTARARRTEGFRNGGQ
jgi:hypothetical protein